MTFEAGFSILPGVITPLHPFTMAETYKRRYGLDWSKQVHDIQIDLILAKKWRFAPFCHGDLLDPGEHMLRAIRALFTPEQWTISPWTEQHAHAWASEDFSVWLGAASTGKAQPLDELIMTPAGPRPMGDLQAGDFVTGLSGAPVRILGTHDAGVKPEYRVVATDGRETRCADDHLWTVANRASHYCVKTLPAKRLVPSKHMLPPFGPVEFQDTQVVPLDPYLLGALLGDGTLGTASGASPLSITSADEGVLREIRRVLPSGYELAFTARHTWRLVKQSRKNNGKNELIQAFKSLKLWSKLSHEKFVPREYLVSSIPTRRRLLAGLLDTDGTVSPQGDISFTTVSLQLAEDVVWLVRSLGGRASLRSKRPWYLKAGVRIQGRQAYNISIYFPDRCAEFLFPGCPRKRARLSSKKCFRKVGIRDVQPTGRFVSMKCITVDSPDGLYLTGSFMPTHNSNDAGGLAVLDWITDPLDTYIALASTSVPMLKLRSFESVLRYFRILKKNPKFLIPGKEAPSQTAIINVGAPSDEEEDNPEADATSKASIRGVALADGDEAKAVARLAGAHLPWTAIILDEGAALPAAAAKARFNAMAGAKRFRFLSLANPISQFDEATKFCAPSGGWLSVTPEDASWRSEYGLVLHHNGFQSPAVLEPDGASKYPFLINQAQIDRMLREVGGNEDDPMIWSMVKGFPAPWGEAATVLSAADLDSFHAREKVLWREGGGSSWVDVAGVDPAFVAEGDGCVMQRGRVGISAAGLHTIKFFPEDHIPIRASSERPGAYQAADGVLRLCAEYNIPLENVAVDDSGTQSVCDILVVESGHQPIRCNFTAKATAEPRVPGKPAPEPRYRNLVTEMWYQTARLVREGQVRELPEAAAEQLCSRRYIRDLRPLALESKKDYKSRRTGRRSPDEADALVLCCRAAFLRANLCPGRHWGQGGLYSRGVSGAGFAGAARGSPGVPRISYAQGALPPRFSIYAGRGASAKKGLTVGGVYDILRNESRNYNHKPSPYFGGVS